MSTSTKRYERSGIVEFLNAGGYDEIDNIIGHNRWEICGSFKRKCKMVGDLDIVLTVPSAKRYPKGVLSCGIEYHVYRTTKVEEITGQNFLATGSSKFNMVLNTKAKRMGYTRRNKGLLDRETGEVIATRINEIMRTVLGKVYRPVERSEEYEHLWGWYKQ